MYLHTCCLPAGEHLLAAAASVAGCHSLSLHMRQGRASTSPARTCAVLCCLSHKERTACLV